MCIPIISKKSRSTGWYRVVGSAKRRYAVTIAQRFRKMAAVNAVMTYATVPVKRIDRPRAVVTMKLDYSQASKYCACGNAKDSYLLYAKELESSGSCAIEILNGSEGVGSIVLNRTGVDKA
ncbi:hypothetical protein SNK04_000096 [Fusarium graminearum]